MSQVLYSEKRVKLTPDVATQPTFTHREVTALIFISSLSVFRHVCTVNLEQGLNGDRPVFLAASSLHEPPLRGPISSGHFPAPHTVFCPPKQMFPLTDRSRDLCCVDLLVGSLRMRSSEIYMRLFLSA